MIATATSTFAGARLLEPIERRQHIQFVERRIQGERLVDAPQRPTHLVGDIACREFAQTFPCPPPSFPAEEQDWTDVSLRQWAKSTATHTTDQNYLCESRYNRRVFCSGKIPPASQTAAVCQMDIPPIPDAFPVKTLLERIQSEKRLIREQRERRWLLAQIVEDYETYWCTQAERDDLFRATEKARRSPHGLPPRTIVKDIDGRVPLNVVPTLKTGNLPRPSDELLREWNEILLEHSQSEKTLLKEEIDFYPPSFAENTFDGHERSSDDEKVGGSEFDGINDNGVRETEQGVPSREKWLEPRRYLFNPLGKKWREATEDDAADVTDRPDFVQASREYAIEFNGLRVAEAAQELGLKPNTLSKRISREELNSMFHDVNFSQTMGHYFCIVTLNGVDHLKILGKAEAPLSEVLAKFLDEWKKSETNAVKQVRKTAKKSGADQQAREKEERDAVEGVRDAYQVVIGLFVPDKDGLGCTYFSFYGHQELIEAALSEWAA